ncbi:molybdenum cofactor biosynthesis protein MoaE [Glycomyces buryatensis]|uniref:Molybdenum cofactor biosynthesis protein MoaE n=1 Tax=Glycomyces buryatensis TaxID=2570927 RepID=A0A4S8QIZ4_9ACTN|nr:molybdenum cofactor biosynthesis protein MoaE [Glycomyces buryatensis]THV42975.1 molybdenum cofactor biosynthesis protein MoaE [Glycomyces buryatensis]
MIRAQISETNLDVAEHERAVTLDAAGAIVTFSGNVRDHDHGRSVTKLSYEGHPSAEPLLREIAEEIAQRPGVHGVAVSHRIGDLAIGDAALVAAVAAEHRKEAFDACADLVDEVKARLPIWKHQFFTDGTEEWVNCP